jgi:hypothetical protein
MALKHIWVDDAGVVREVGPFTPEERVVLYDTEVAVPDMKQALLDFYKEKGISHPLHAQESKQ